MLSQRLLFPDRKSWLIGVVFATLFTAVFWASNLYAFPDAANAHAKELFSDAPPGFVAPQPRLEREKKDPTIKRSRRVKINLDLLYSPELPFPGLALPDVAPIIPYTSTPSDVSIVLNLFPDISFQIIKDRIEIRSKNRYTWYGHIEGIENSRVIMVNENGSIAGDIFVRPDEMYQISDIDGTVQALYDIDPTAFPPLSDPIPVYEDGTAEPMPPMALCCDSGSLIDVMVVYTSAAAAASGNIISEIQLAIDTTNAAYANSLINQRLRLVHTAEIPYAETSNYTMDLQRLQNPSDGYMDEVHTHRDTYHADLVNLWVETMTGAGGVAYQMRALNNSFESSAFSVVRRTANAFAHELGHNMGADHDRANAGAYGTIYPYSYGYYNSAQGFGTIMSYPGFHIPNFSNPLVTYNGVPTGITEGQPNSADNARTLNSTAYTVSNFRQSDGSNVYTGSMTAARGMHTATLLPDGKVLIAGGINSGYLSSTELYGPASGTFTLTGPMATARIYHTATLLPNGKVLIAGGYNGASYQVSAELYDPVTGTFTTTGSMSVPRGRHTATMLPNGKVLITGGYNGLNYHSSAELYDPAIGTFTSAGSMTVARGYHASALLPDGRVLITGGYTGIYHSSAELYNPANGIFTATGSMTVSRGMHTATSLPGGKVLVAGGLNGSYHSSVELYNPVSGTFTGTGTMSVARSSHAATSLPNGEVLITGGAAAPSDPLASAERYDPASGNFVTDSMIAARWGHGATLLSNGKVLITGGRSYYNYLASAELIAPPIPADVVPPETIASPAGGTYGSAQSVTLVCSDGTGSGCDKIYYTVDGTTPTTASMVYSTAIGIFSTETLKFFASDFAGNTEAVKSEQYTVIDSIAPTGAIYISFGAAATNSSTITLITSCADAGGCAQMQFSNDGSAWSAWEAFAGSKSWTLSSGVGAKTVYVKFKDIAGNISAPVSDSILLVDSKNGVVMAWGYNNSGQVGDGTTVNRSAPVQVGGLAGVVDLAVGDGHSLVLKSDGTVWGWGVNWGGQLGDGTTVINRNTPVQVVGLTGVVDVSGGFYHSLALKFDGTVSAWGYNVYGELGDGTISPRTTPVQVAGLTGIVSIESGLYHSIALKSDGTVWAWGYNSHGQLGDGTTTDKRVPVQVSGLTGVVAITGGYYHSLALKIDGTVWAWGYNVYGQLGDGTTTDRHTPVQVSGLTDVVAVAGGAFHTVFLKSDGTVWSWGYNMYGELGDGTGTPKHALVLVSGLTDVVAITGGSFYSLALKTDGTVWSWGRNAWGALGDGTLIDKPAPVQVSGLTGVVSIAGSFNHVLTLSLDTISPMGAISINGGADVINSASATLALTCEDDRGCAQMQFSNDNLTWSEWESYSASKPWVLLSAEGTQTLYVRFRDEAGNVSIIYNDSIILDTVQPALTINPVSSTVAADVTIDGTVEAGASVAIATDTAASDGAAVVNGSTWSFHITGLVDGENIVTITACDQAGNIASKVLSITKGGNESQQADPFSLYLFYRMLQRGK